MAITAVVNRKGGASKSTISLNLAAVMAEAGNRVLLIDADPQQTAQDWLAIRDDAAPFQILGLPKPVLHRELPNLAGDYDQIIIDRRAHRARTRAARPGGSGDAGHPRGVAGADVMKRAAFKQPRQASTVADEWVKGDQAAEAPAPQPTPPKVAMTRLTIDLPADLHHRFKVACAIYHTKMVDEVRHFIEEWTQQHGNL